MSMKFDNILFEVILVQYGPQYSSSTMFYL